MGMGIPMGMGMGKEFSSVTVKPDLLQPTAA